MNILAFYAFILFSVSSTLSSVSRIPIHSFSCNQAMYFITLIHMRTCVSVRVCLYVCVHVCSQVVSNVDVLRKQSYFTLRFTGSIIPRTPRDVPRTPRDVPRS